jgi:glyoxylase-like metal-dependent hydrolase (beta-lactamase superfamily II)
MTLQVEPIADTFVNMYLIREPDGLTLIDAGTPGGLKAVERALQKKGERLADIRSILITHADPDHIGGAAALQAATGAALYAGGVEAAAMAEGRSSREPRASPAMAPMFNLMNTMMPITPVQASGILKPGDELPILGGLRVVATPGHTPGHLSFFAPAYGLLFAGDALMVLGGRPRFLDGPFTWDYTRGRESLRQLAELAPKIICAGHGRVLRNVAIL